MFNRKVATILLISVFALAVSSDGLLHAAIPHNHADEHGAGESIVWSSLHSALRHDDKKFLFVLATMLASFLVIFSVVRIVTVRTRSLVACAGDVRARDPVLGQALCRGILAHRCFR